MEHKGIKIYAIVKSYNLWSLYKDGRLDEPVHERGGQGLIAYTFSMDNSTSGEWEYETIKDCTVKIDELLKEQS